MSLFGTDMQKFFAAGEKVIEEKVGTKGPAVLATCCGNCQENIIRPPHMCKLLDNPAKKIPPFNAMILNPYVKLKDCPYPGEAVQK
jgi:hypothetical protein